MAGQETIYDPSVADGRFQLEVLGLRWSLVALYALFFGVGVIDVAPPWFAASEGFLVAYHLYYTWLVRRNLTGPPLAPATAYATPFLDTVAVSLALTAIGDPLHPIWGVYFFVIVGVMFFYYAVVRAYVVWLVGCYAMVGVGLQLRGIDVPAPAMGVGMIILLAALYDLAAYTGGERRLRGKIAAVARTDPLTNLRNRRGLEEALDRRLPASARESKGLAALMIDVDRFKRYNDQYGHLAADGVLEQLAAILSASMREPDLVARYGGDEFVVIIPDVRPDEAPHLAERLRRQIARSGLCTVSIGVSASASLDANAQSLLDSADTALLAAKQAGRNCVRTAPAAEPQAA